jgi:hypothetical protein
MFRHCISTVLIICATIGWSGTVFAAQSTTDGPLIKEIKWAGREPLLGSRNEDMTSAEPYLMGNVASPGIFYLDYPITLVQVIARSGGFNEWASKELTLVREKVGGQDNDFFKGNTMEFDYDRFISGKDIGRNIAVHSGDIIIVR